MTAQTYGETASPHSFSRHRYTSVAVVLHWLIAVLIIGNLVNGALMEGGWKACGARSFPFTNPSASPSWP